MALGLCYSSTESIQEAVKTKKGVYWSRTRGLWRKGETSGNQQVWVLKYPVCTFGCIAFQA